MNLAVRVLGVAVALLLSPLALAQEADPPPALSWHDARDLEIEGRGWVDAQHPFNRLPAEAKDLVRPDVWKLSQDSAGLAARFTTDADQIRVRWTLRRATLALPHMAATGVSGVDLYVRHGGHWRWLATGLPDKVPTNEEPLVEGLSPGEREYLLYLPLYNGVTSLEIGVPEGAHFKTTARTPAKRPIVFYGTSIVQGACASRPGMAYPAIVGRTLDWPTVNLGFSGQGKAEPEVANLLAQLDPSVYVIDPMPNNGAPEVPANIEPFVARLRSAHGKTPIVLVENVPYSNGYLIESRHKRYTESNAALRDMYMRLRKAGDRHLYYVRAADLFGSDGNDTVDGTHPTDLGFTRMAQALTRALAPLLR